MDRRAEIWANVRPDHLTPDERRKATERKQELLRLQDGRGFLRTELRTKEARPWAMYCQEETHLTGYLERAIHIADKGPTIVVIETRGNSRRWINARRRLDGGDFYDNGESVGVEVMVLVGDVRDALV